MDLQAAVSQHVVSVGSSSSSLSISLLTVMIH